MDTDTPQKSQHLHTIKLEGGVQALGPYSVGKIVNYRANYVFLSGTLGIDPLTQNLISDNVADQTRQVMINIGEQLKAARSGYENIVKCVVYLVDMGDFAKVNEEYAKFFKSDFPARVCIAVKQLPKNGLVEIEVTAVQNDQGKVQNE